jgi:hypothetical protein
MTLAVTEISRLPMIITQAVHGTQPDPDLRSAAEWAAGFSGVSVQVSEGKWPGEVAPIPESGCRTVM